MRDVRHDRPKKSFTIIQIIQNLVVGQSEYLGVCPPLSEREPQQGKPDDHCARRKKDALIVVQCDSVRPKPISRREAGNCDDRQDDGFR